MKVIMLSHSTLWSNCSSRLVPALGLHSIITRCRSKSSERTLYLKQRVFGEVGQELGGNRRMDSSLFAARASERTVVIEEETSQKSESSSLKVFPGQAHPLGVSEVESGVNFAIFSQNATAITLCLVLQESGIPNVDAKVRNFHLSSTACWGIPNKLDEGMIELQLDPQVNKTGDIWHIRVKLGRLGAADKLVLLSLRDFHMLKDGGNLMDLPRSNVLYGYRVDGSRDWSQGHRFDFDNILLDPYAKLIEGRRVFGDASNKMSKFIGTYDFDCLPFNWGESYKLPNIHEKDLVIYEMNVRAFTADDSSELDAKIRGSYLGVIEKIPHLLELGVNAVELLPVFEFDEMELQRRPNPRDHMINTWGYSTINFFAPMSRYASNGTGPINAAREFKEMVKALHDAGIEVILDVVYNHTNEADDGNPYTTSFRGIDNKVYYMLDSNAQLLNFSGCGNTLNCNHPVVMELILDSLKHWVSEYHVDGFRFDLASVLCRGTDGSPLSAPPLIRAIAKDNILSRCKIIAEPWDCGGLYLVGKFPNWDRWAEWNGIYRDDIRRFIKGDTGMKGSFATRVAGSADLYQVNKRKPYHGINFVIAHDGFTLYDLVSYSFKHNDANGEGGNDGCNDNFSWNCGFEGETADANIKALRLRQMKNFHVALMISQGTPMMLMGDEYGHTRYGNNNSYGHDNALNHFQWGQLKDKTDNLFRFFSEMIKFRHSHHVFTKENFIGKNEVTWHEDNWENYESKFLAFTLHEENGGDMYVAFNAHDYFVKASIPAPPQRRQWYRVVDTNLESPSDIAPEGVPGVKEVYNMAPYSSVILEAKP